jgi:hypothetical protein
MALALTLGPPPLHGLDDVTLAAAWREHRDRVLADYPATHRPWAWWRFEAAVPEELRPERPGLRPVGEPAPPDLHLARAAWLHEQATGAGGSTMTRGGPR